MYHALGLLIVVILCLVYIYRQPENLITEPAYMLMSRGFNLPAPGGNYLGGMYLLNAAETANTVSDIQLAY